MSKLESNRVHLGSFNNSWYSPGRSIAIRLVWLAVNSAFFLTWIPWPSRLKAWILRSFGASIGRGVVFKNRINVKYPWNLSVGDDSWIGEGVWIDSLANVTIGANVCLSQGVMIETGNHDWGKSTFDLVLKDVILEDGAWAAVRSLLLPGSLLRSHAILGAGSVLSGDTVPYGIYVGSPAKKVRERLIEGPG